MTKDKWYCYVCGKFIGDTFMLCSMNDNTDRVFLAHEGACFEQMGEATYSRKVKGD